MSTSHSPLPSSSTGDSPPPSKARRLSCKQPCQALPPPQAPLPLVPEFWQDIDKESFCALNQRRQYRLVYNKFWWWFKRAPEVSFPEGSICSQELWSLAQVQYDVLNKYQKSTLIRHFMIVTHAPHFLFLFAQRQWCVSKEEKETKAFAIDSFSALLTYQGNWGVVASDTLGAALSDEELTQEVRKLPVVMAKCRLFGRHCELLANRLTAPFCAWAVEICLKTWRQEQTLRLHGHVFVKKHDRRMRCESEPALSFEGSIPHCVAYVMGRPATGWAGAYYVLAPKLGSVQTGGTLDRNLDFPVNPEWVFSMVESRKITYEDARSELIRCAKACDRRLKDLDCWHKNNQEAALKRHVEQRQIEIRSTLKPFPSWPVVDAWLEEVMKPAQSRKRVLVLSGPSRTGKTEFVRTLFPIGAVLELNCAGVDSVCLVGFDSTKHRCLLWDEASPNLVSKHRKVFQHPACWVDLGHSPTGQHVINVFLNDSCSVIATNSWNSQALQLPAEDQAWLAANVVVFDVTQPLWEVA